LFSTKLSPVKRLMKILQFMATSLTILVSYINYDPEYSKLDRCVFTFIGKADTINNKISTEENLRDFSDLLVT